MKDEEKKVNNAEEVKTEEQGVQLTDEDLEQVNAGLIDGKVTQFLD